MNEADFEITGAWRAAPDGGQAYEAVARTRKSKRHVSRATGTANVTTMEELDRIYGTVGRIETSVNEVCRQLALGAPS